MTYTLTQAAKATGKSRSTVLRAIRAGRVSAARDEVTGGWVIDPSELHRLYDAVDNVASVAADGGRDLVHDTPRNSSDLAAHSLAAELRELRARLEVTEARLADKDAVIADLRQQRDRAQQHLERITDQRTTIATAPTAAPRRSWWHPWKRG